MAQGPVCRGGGAVTLASQTRSGTPLSVVLVHGTASSPARWAEMANELLGDPAIGSRYQIWGFIYNSGNPNALSAMRLRESLKAFLKAQPLPFVKRVVFIATPHRGSFLESNPIAKFANKFIDLPGGLAKSAVEVGRSHDPSTLGTPFTIPTALDNMDEVNS